MKIFIVVIILSTVIGGFVGAELLGGDFSVTGAVVGGAGVFSILMGLGAFFDFQEREKKEKNLSPEIRGVFDRMLGQNSTLTRSAQSAPKIKRKFNVSCSAKTEPAEDEYVSIAEKLVGAQLLPKYPKQEDSFSFFMTNKNASGYVFGLHDALLQKLGLYTVGEKENASNLIERSYKNMFGEQAGYALFSMSLSHQDDSDFQNGRMEGGNDIFEYLKNKTSPLGLGRIHILNLKSQRNDNKPNPLKEFENKISTWPGEQARTALLLLKATIRGDQDQIESLYLELTVSQLKAVEGALRKMEKE